MPRLGRQRRVLAKLVRNVSTPTVTPLVRKGVVIVKPDSRAYQFIGRLGRARRNKRIVRAPSVPTATPLTRKGFIVVGLSRRPHIWAARIGRTRRDRHQLKAPSVPTATPLVRNRTLERLSRPRLAFFKRRPARLSRPPRPTLEPARRIFQFRARRPIRHHQARLLRALSIPTPAPARVLPIHIFRARRPIRHHQARTAKAPSVPTATPLVRNRVTVRTAVRPARLHVVHHQARILLGTRGSSAPIVTVVPLRSLTGVGL